LNQPVLSNEGIKFLAQGNNGSLFCGSNPTHCTTPPTHFQRYGVLI